MNIDKDFIEALPYAAVGAAKGIYDYYVKPELSAKRAWLAMGLGILAYELAAPNGQLLSEGADRAIERHPLLTRFAIGAVALHLANVLPERLDIVHQAVKIIKA